MTAKHPNVLFLSVDALRPDRMSLHGYVRPTTPTLDRLADNAIICEQNTSPTAFTQPALPSMLTSSMPLSYGGYDKGANGRPPTVFKAFADAGFETTMISTFPWVNRFYGYGDGVHHEQWQFVINSLMGVAAQTMASSLMAYKNQTVTKAAMMEIVRPVTEKLFDDLETYCDKRMEQADFDSVDMAGERLIRDGYDYRRVKKVIARHRREFSADPDAYVARHMLPHPKTPQSHQWMAEDWRYTRRLGALFEYGLERILANILMPVAPSKAQLMEYKSKRYVDGHALADRVIRMIDNRDAERPFFIWSHFFDTHVPYCPGIGAGWTGQVPEYLSALGYPPDIDPAIGVAGMPKTEEEWSAWSALYDGAVRYVDDQIGRIIKGLEDRGLAEDTLVVVTSDHGEELGEHGDISHHFRLYEHNIRVPMVFHRPGQVAQKISGLTTLLDLAPTMAELAGIPAPGGWEGMPVTADAIDERTHVIAEAFHGGNCLFAHRPPYIAVRTQRFKYLWKEYRDPTDAFSDEGPELYDHQNDPLEQNNLYRPDHPELPGLHRVVAARLVELPEISPERIVAAFGDIGRDALGQSRKKVANT